MRRFRLPHRILPVLALLAACSRAPGPDPAPPAQDAADNAILGTLLALHATWGDAFTRGDQIAVTRLYAPDAVLMLPSGDVIGHRGISEYFADIFDGRRDTVLAINTSSEALDMAGDRAYEAGTITYTVAPRARPTESRVVQTRYLAFWGRNPEGYWRITRMFRPVP